MYVFCFVVLLAPFVNMWFRLNGTEIGSRVWMDTTEITEHDLVRIGDDCALATDCTLQTHLFEDRVMKMSYLTIGNNCSVGHMSTVLYDAEMKTGSNLHSLSLLMKGETLPAWSSWEGTPAKRTKSYQQTRPTTGNGCCCWEGDSVITKRLVQKPASKVDSNLKAPLLGGGPVQSISS